MSGPWYSRESQRQVEPPLPWILRVIEWWEDQMERIQIRMDARRERMARICRYCGAPAVARRLCVNCALQ